MTTRNIQFPDMRANVIDAVSALADRQRQVERWGVQEPDDLSLQVHVLYDDCQVLPDPAARVGAVVYEEEVASLLVLNAVLDPMIEDLGDQPDSAYTADQRWNDVVAAAAGALGVMRQCDAKNGGTPRACDGGQA